MEPDKGDLVYGWWGWGRVTDVAIGQGTSRIQPDSGQDPLWTRNKDILINDSLSERQNNDGNG